MTMRVIVNARHIREGERRNEESCAIALAVQDRWGSAERVRVFLDSQYLKDEVPGEPYPVIAVTTLDDRIVCLSPCNPRRFAEWGRAFDEGEDVAPTWFDLDDTNVVPEAKATEEELVEGALDAAEEHE